MNEADALNSAIEALQHSAGTLEVQRISAPRPPMEFCLWAKTKAVEYRQAADQLAIMALRSRAALVQREREMGRG